MPRIQIVSGSTALAVELNDTPTAKRLLALLPFESSANRWGQEIYFGTPLAAESERDARAEVEVGAVAYWPPGKALCVFWGPTPASSGDEPCAASPVNLVGKVVGPAAVAAKVEDGAPVRVERAPAG